MRLDIFTMIIFMIMRKFPGVHASNITWTTRLNYILLNVYFNTLPSDRQQNNRMEAEWAIQVPDFKGEAGKNLQRRAKELITQINNLWKQKPEEERQRLEERLSRISTGYNAFQSSNEGSTFIKLLEQYPEYRVEELLIRCMVHVWYRQNTMRSRGEKGLHVNEVAWTPQLNADLWYIANAVKMGAGDVENRIKFRWSQMHRDLNLKASSLYKKFKFLKKVEYRPSKEEELEAKRKYHELFPHEIDGSGEEEVHRREFDRARRWSRQRCADLLYMYNQLKSSNQTVLNNLKDQWAKLYGNYYPLDGPSLNRQARRLINSNYLPTAEEMTKAEKRCGNLTSQDVIDLKVKKTSRKRNHNKGTGIHIESTDYVNDRELDSSRLWSKKRKAELLCIYNNSENSPKTVEESVASRWNKMYGCRYPLDGVSLMKQVRCLIEENYVSKLGDMAGVKKRYDSLPLLNVTDHKNKGILDEPVIEEEPENCTAPIDHTTRGYNRNGDISSLRIHVEHGIQQEHIHDTGYHTANTHNFQEVGNDASSSKHPIDLDLNLPYEEFDLNEPYHQYEHDGYH